MCWQIRGTFVRSFLAEPLQLLTLICRQQFTPAACGGLRLQDRKTKAFLCTPRLRATLAIGCFDSNATLQYGLPRRSFKPRGGLSSTSTIAVRSRILGATRGFVVHGCEIERSCRLGVALLAAQRDEFGDEGVGEFDPGELDPSGAHDSRPAWSGFPAPDNTFRPVAVLDS
jgi:hypothetical protein